jgi:hypothetical protein
MKLTPYFALLAVSAAVGCGAPPSEPSASRESAAMTEGQHPICGMLYKPVCGVPPSETGFPSYGQTYTNYCFAELVGATFIAEGACPRVGDSCTPGQSPYCTEGNGCFCTTNCDNEADPSGTCAPLPSPPISGQSVVAPGQSARR